MAKCLFFYLFSLIIGAGLASKQTQYEDIEEKADYFERETNVTAVIGGPQHVRDVCLNSSDADVLIISHTAIDGRGSIISFDLKSRKRYAVDYPEYVAAALSHVPYGADYRLYYMYRDGFDIEVKYKPLNGWGDTVDLPELYVIAGGVTAPKGETMAMLYDPKKKWNKILISFSLPERTRICSLTLTPTEINVWKCYKLMAVEIIFLKAFNGRWLHALFASEGKWYMTSTYFEIGENNVLSIYNKSGDCLLNPSGVVVSVSPISATSLLVLTYDKKLAVLTSSKEMMMLTVPGKTAQLTNILAKEGGVIFVSSSGTEASGIMVESFILTEQYCQAAKSLGEGCSFSEPVADKTEKPSDWTTQRAETNNHPYNDGKDRNSMVLKCRFVSVDLADGCSSAYDTKISAEYEMARGECAYKCAMIDACMFICYSETLSYCELHVQQIKCRGDNSFYTFNAPVAMDMICYKKFSV